MENRLFYPLARSSPFPLLFHLQSCSRTQPGLQDHFLLKRNKVKEGELWVTETGVGASDKTQVLCPIRTCTAGQCFLACHKAGSFLSPFEGPVLQGTLIKAKAILSFGALPFFTVLQNACG